MAELLVVAALAVGVAVPTLPGLFVAARHPRSLKLLVASGRSAIFAFTFGPEPPPSTPQNDGRKGEIVYSTDNGNFPYNFIVSSGIQWLGAGFFVGHSLRCGGHFARRAVRYGFNAAKSRK